MDRRQRPGFATLMSFFDKHFREVTTGVSIVYNNS